MLMLRMVTSSLKHKRRHRYAGSKSRGCRLWVRDDERLVVLSFPFLLRRHAAAATEIAVARDGPGQAANIVLKGTVLIFQLCVVLLDEVNLFGQGC